MDGIWRAATATCCCNAARLRWRRCANRPPSETARGGARHENVVQGQARAGVVAGRDRGVGSKNRLDCKPNWLTPDLYRRRATRFKEATAALAAVTGETCRRRRSIGSSLKRCGKRSLHRWVEDDRKPHLP